MDTDNAQLVSFGYGADGEEKPQQNAEVRFIGNSREERRSFVNSKYYFVGYIFTSIIFVIFFVACLALLVRINRSDAIDSESLNRTLSRKLELLDQNFKELISTSHSLQDAADTKSLNNTLRQNLELLKQDIEQMFASSQSEAVDKESFDQTLNQKLEMLRQKVKEMIDATQSLQAETWRKVVETMNENSDTFRREINEVMSSFRSLLSQNQSTPPMYIASNNRVYELQYKAKKNYTDAEAACEERNARLASAGIRDSVVERELLDFVQSSPIPNLCYGKLCYWIGLEYSHESYHWEWSDGVSNFSTIEWGPGQPNYGEYCGVFYPELGNIHDWPCSTKLYYVCEKLLPGEDTE